MDRTTKECIRKSILTLIAQKDYADIQMKEIAENANVGRRTLYRYFPNKDAIMLYEAECLLEQFSKKILQMKARDLYTISASYFSFWEDNVETLKLLKKTHLLYFIEDNLTELIMEVACRTKYYGKDMAEAKEMAKQHPEMMYDFYFKVAGFWKLTLIWMEETPRKTPEEMSEYIVKILG